MELTWKTPKLVEADQGRMDAARSAVRTNSGPAGRPAKVNGARGPTDHEDWSPPVMRQVRWLLVGLGLLAAVDAVTSQIAYRQFSAAVDMFLSVAGEGSTNGRFVVNTLSFSIVTSTAIGVSMVVMASVLVYGLRRPSQATRVVGIVAMIFLSLAQCVGIGSNPNLFADPSVEITGDLAATWDALVPNWYVWTHYAVETAILVAAVTVGVKLSTAKATEFFALRHLVAADDSRLWSTEPFLALVRRR